jgi:signal transduction histidine kinase
MEIAAPEYDEVPPLLRETTTALGALAVAALVVAGFRLGFHVDNAHNGLIGASFTAVGLYVLRMRPRHGVGRLFLAVGIGHAVMFFGRQYGLHEGPLPGGAWIGWFGVWPLPLLIALFGWTLMVFPNGRFVSQGWRVAALVMVGCAAISALASALWPIEYDRMAMVSPHPLNMPDLPVESAVGTLTGVSYAASQLLWSASIVVRMRRATGDEARQLRWLVYAVVMDLLVLAVGMAVLDSPVPGLLGLPLIPVAAGVAVLKYRLYAIDPVINKTIVVGGMALLITAGYVAIVIGLGAVAPVDDRVLTLATTAVVAVLFEPLRRRVQQLADRLVYGRRTTPYEALAQLSAHVAEPPQDLLGHVTDTVAKGVGATEVVVWVGQEPNLVARASWPEPPSGRPAQVTRPLVHQGRSLGMLSVRKPVGEYLTAAEERLLGDLVGQTVLVLVQQEQERELRAAARRIVTAEDAARRRMERDLHDGIQHRLVTLAMELGMAAKTAASLGGDALAAQVETAREHLMEATADLRELARGLHPMVLSQSGLEAALAALADRSRIPVRLRAAVDGDLPDEVAATAYYVVSEALTNAAKHSRADVVTVAVARTITGLEVTVSDDGRGGAQPSPGSGLEGLSDRVAALGARLSVTSPIGGGTTIRTVLPCE